MNLKRNDKIILIIGVVILIVAGAGIALYNAPSYADNDDNMEDADEMYYRYAWMQDSGSKHVETPMVNEDSSFEGSYTAESPVGSVLTQIIVHIDWKDDNTFGLLRTKGKDILTAEVTLDGETLDENSEMEGNLTFPFNINSMPIDGRINASSEQEATSKLETKYADENTANFDVTLMIETGEPWWRFLFNRDNGNEVDISIEYTYYKNELTEVENDDMRSTGGEDEFVVSSHSHSIGEFYVNLGYGRGMI